MIGGVEKPAEKMGAKRAHKPGAKAGPGYGRGKTKATEAPKRPGTGKGFARILRRFSKGKSGRRRRKKKAVSQHQGGLFLFVFAIGFFAVGGGQHDADKVCGDGQAKQQAAGEIRKRAVGAVCKKDIRQIQHIAQDDEGKGGF